jgi:hypothetical protein
MSLARAISLAVKEVRISGIGRDSLRALARFLSFRANLFGRGVECEAGLNAGLRWSAVSCNQPY